MATSSRTLSANGGTEIALGCTGSDDHHPLTGHLLALGHLEGRPDGRTTGDTGGEPLKQTKLLGGFKGILIGNLHHLIHYLGIEVARNESGSNSLNLVRPPGPRPR